MRTTSWLATLLTVSGLLGGFEQPTIAQLQPDNTLGTERSQVNSGIINALPSDVINGGARRGVNLFHSFLNFNVAEGQRVYFGNPAGILNILTRVTGNNPSAILGTLGVDGGANLFLLNPNGILFGGNSRLDMRGSFTATTANSFTFPDGSQFSAVQPSAPPLLTINVTPGLQYGTSPANITNAGKLEVGGSLTLAGGNIITTGELRAAGDLTLVAQNTVQIRDSVSAPFIAQAGGKLLVQGNQTVDIFALNHPNSGLFSGGDMVLRSPNSIIGDAHYWTGGNFRIEQLNYQPGNLASPNDPIIRATGDVTINGYIGPSLHILAGGKVTITGGVQITGPGLATDTLQETITLSDGRTINIDGAAVPTLDIRAGTLNVGTPPVTNFSGFLISPPPIISLAPANLNQPATGSDIFIGDINVTAPNGVVFLTNNYAPNQALSGGDITVQGTNFFGTGAGIRANSITGNGGSVTIDANRNLTLNGPINTSSTIGNAGDVKLLAGNTLTVNQSIASNTSGTGTAGQISIAAPQVTVQNSANISANTFGSGAGGNLTVTAQTLTLQQNAQLSALTGNDLRNNPLATANTGAGGNITLNIADSINLLSQSVITTQTNQLSTGNAGNLSIHTNNLTLQDGSYLAATSQGSGKGGDITLDIGNALKLQGTSTINTQTGIYLNSFNSGDAGNLTVLNAQQIAVSDGALMAASASSRGRAGNITVNTPNALMQLVGASATTASSILSETSGSGNGGDIQMRVRQLVLQDGGQIAGQTIGAGNAGTLNIAASESLQIVGQTGKFVSRLAFDSANDGNAGELRIQTPVLRVAENGRISGRTSAAGRGGVIDVVAPIAVDIDRGGLFFDSSGSGNPRGIQVSTGQLTVRNSGQLTVSSTQSAIAGNLDINAPQVSLQQGTLTAETQSGSGGNIRFQNLDALVMSDRSRISASTVDGSGGTVTVTASDRVSLDQSSQISATATGNGSAGDVQLTTRRLDIRGESQASVSSRGTGNAGNLDITAPEVSLQQGILSAETQSSSGGNIRFQNLDSLIMTDRSRISASTVDGSGGTVTVTASDRVSLDQSSQISATATGNGSAGDVQLTTRQLDIRGESQASVSSRGTGNAGNLDISAPQVTLQQSILSAETQSGSGGNIRFQNLDSLIMTDRSQISASTVDGKGGDVTVTASDRVSLDQSSQINAAATGNGSAGNIVVTTGTLTVQNNSQLNVRSEGSGSAGNLTIRSSDLFMSDGARLFATTASGEGGNIDVRVDRSIILRRDSDIRTQALGSGNGGNIRLEAGLAIVGVLSEDSDVIASAVTGRGGSIFAKAPVIIGFRLFDRVETPESDFIASSEFGIDGTLSVNANNPRTLPALADNFAMSRLSEGCSANTASSSTIAPRNQFINTQRGGLPLSAIASLSSQTLWQDDRPSTATTPVVTAPTHQPDQIVEANTWMRLPDGSIVLTVSSTGAAAAVPPVANPQSSRCYNWLTSR